jgi:hypothetical protein
MNRYTTEEATGLAADHVAGEIAQEALRGTAVEIALRTMYDTALTTM